MAVNALGTRASPFSLKPPRLMAGATLQAWRRLATPRARPPAMLSGMDPGRRLQLELSTAVMGGDTQLADVTLPPIEAVGHLATALHGVTRSIASRLSRKSVRATTSARHQIEALQRSVARAYECDVFGSVNATPIGARTPRTLGFVALELHFARARVLRTAEHVEQLVQALDTQLDVVPRWRAQIQQIVAASTLSVSQPSRLTYQLRHMLDLVGEELDEFSEIARTSRDCHRQIQTDIIAPWLAEVDQASASARLSRRVALRAGQVWVRLRRKTVDRFLYRAFSQSTGVNTGPVAAGIVQLEESSLKYYEVPSRLTSEQAASIGLHESTKRLIKQLGKAADRYAALEQRLSCVRCSLDQATAWLELNALGLDEVTAQARAAH